MQFRVLLAASAAAGALATSALATTIDITGAAMTNPAYVTFSYAATPNTIYETVEDAPLELTTSTGGTVLAFCIDIWHAIDLGSVSTNYSKTALVYQSAPLLTDSSGSVTGTGNALTSTEIGEIGGLIYLGETMARADTDPDLAIDLSAIQAAIWQIANPSMVVAASAPDPADGRNTSAVTTELNDQIAYYENYVLSPANQSGDFTTYYDTVDNTQGIGVTEPEAWVLMLLGMGGSGAVLRSARRRKAAEAAGSTG